MFLLTTETGGGGLYSTYSTPFRIGDNPSNVPLQGVAPGVALRVFLPGEGVASTKDSYPEPSCSSDSLSSSKEGVGTCPFTGNPPGSMTFRSANAYIAVVFMLLKVLVARSWIFFFIIKFSYT